MYSSESGSSAAATSTVRAIAAAAVIDAWYAGEAGGIAVAEVLFGDVSRISASNLRR